ncbi:hypothetical protein L3X38_004489 [Prunus dulcis]|uniref:Integrase zinc-binding domain-containing protein n=1 Tax=Prunus dulcis TaxID=3755 RepID=A0AAD4ZP27_PRUDU|nr:hypothetical protein L3X38_004489 [Prunus dulcis]
MAYLSLLVELQKEGVELGINQQGGLLASLHVRPISVEWNEDLKREIMEEAHCSAYSMHAGSTKMYRTLREYYSWPHMKGDIARYVSRCLISQQD